MPAGLALTCAVLYSRMAGRDKIDQLGRPNRAAVTCFA